MNLQCPVLSRLSLLVIIKSLSLMKISLLGYFDSENTLYLLIRITRPLLEVWIDPTSNTDWKYLFISSPCSQVQFILMNKILLYYHSLSVYAQIYIRNRSLICHPCFKEHNIILQRKILSLIHYLSYLFTS
jgi:hypothetical protein